MVGSGYSLISYGKGVLLGVEDRENPMERDGVLEGDAGLFVGVDLGTLTNVKSVGSLLDPFPITHWAIIGPEFPEG